jgi:hypothetical protein
LRHSNSDWWKRIRASTSRELGFGAFSRASAALTQYRSGAVPPMAFASSAAPSMSANFVRRSRSFLAVGFRRALYRVASEPAFRSGNSMRTGGGAFPSLGVSGWNSRRVGSTFMVLPVALFHSPGLSCHSRVIVASFGVSPAAFRISW